MKILYICVMTFLLSGILAGCGIKPNQVSSPVTDQKDEFPHIYPNPETDPK